MAKVKISEFSANPANNTDIDGINIAENCPPSGINDAIRELMAQLKDFQAGTAGDSFNGPVGTTTAAAGAFTTLSASGAVTLSAATANGVVYANGSKVLTTGSALTYNGTTLTADTASTSAANFRIENGSFNRVGTFQLTSAGVQFDAFDQSSTSTQRSFMWLSGGSEQMRLTSTGLGIGTSSPAQKLDVRSDTSGTSVRVSTSDNGNIARIGWKTGASFIAAEGYNSPALTFETGGTERMRLDSSGNLGIGTSSPGYKLDVRGVLGSGNGTITTGFSYDSGGLVGTFSNHALGILTNGNVIAKFDTSGNLGLGVTPSAWSGAVRGLQVGYGASFAGHTSVDIGYFGANWYFDGSANRYIHSAFASRQIADGNSGGFAWQIAPSGTAGNAISFTQSMSLTAAGDLLIGTTSGSHRITAVVNSGADRDIFLGAVSGVTNGFRVQWNHATSKIRVSIQNLPTSSSGLDSGTLYVDGGFLKVA